MSYVTLIISLGIILAGAEFFTNGVEWLGKKLHLSEGAVGSILAAVGTALPETMIPVIAILFGSGEEATHIGIGAILGAPFMLSTLAMLVTGVAALTFKANGVQRTCMLCDISIMRRDISFFIIVYFVALAAAFLPHHWAKVIVAVFLVGAYLVYAIQTIKSGQSCGESEVPPLIFRKSMENPSLSWVIFQTVFALLVIVLGANLFVGAITEISTAWGVPAFILAIIIAPIATELPEKFNSIVWVKHCKDTLALGNITGAMVFQSSMIPALGILMTPWELSPLALISGCLALLSAIIIYINLRFRQKITPQTLIGVGLFYVVFFLIVVFKGSAWSH